MHSETGVILGKFCPLHAGHVALIRAAQAITSELTLIMLCEPDDPIPSGTRIKWLRDISPALRLGTISAGFEIISDAQKCKDAILAFIPDGPDRIIGSDPQIVPVAQALGCQHTVLDPAPFAYPVSSDGILKAPFKYWMHIPEIARPFFQHRLTFVGPESSGKSYLSQKLAHKFGWPHVPEYGRPYEKYRGEGKYKAEELHEIVTVHTAHRNAISRTAGPILIEDTDELLTAVWAEMLLGHSLPDLEARITLANTYLLLDSDIPWEDDPIRYYTQPELRDKFYRLTCAKLDALGANYVKIGGSYESREAQVMEIVTHILTENGYPL